MSGGDTTRITARPGDAIDLLLDRCGRRIVCATPLGLGKPVALLNALYQRAIREPDIQLTFVTALSLAVPRAGSELERRFLEPFAKRVFDGVPELDYLAALERQALPSNIVVREFYFRPGSMLHNPTAQQQYISSNYTHVARDVVAMGCNVILVMVSERDGRYSLSCNPDLVLDVARMLRAAGRDVIVAALVNRRLPFMPHDAEVGPEYFDIIVDAAEYETRLFSVPNSPTVAADHAVGFHAAALVPDDATLQLGIGSLGDAVAFWLRARQQEPAKVSALASALSLDRYAPLVQQLGGTDGFARGLFAASEMFTWGLMSLYQAGVLKRRVYENEDLQDALNRGVIDDDLPADALERLHAAGTISDPLAEHDVEWLEYFGVLSRRVAPGTSIAEIPGDYRGNRLQHGQVLHGAFFLGPEAFYEALRDLPDEERALFNMMPVSKVNDLFGEEALERLQRKRARFINVCMKATLFGAVASDATDDNRVVSGVGGQYNFVAMAHELEDARSILCLRATRESHGRVESNIVFEYGHTTIPRHLRDIVITEYGIADLRGRTDAECAMAMLEIADSRFQQGLLEQAQKAGKLPAAYQVPAHASNNTSAALERRLAAVREYLPLFPLGTDFTPVEQRLVPALSGLRNAAASWRGRLGLLKSVIAISGTPTADEQEALMRMGLENPSTLRERVLRRVVLAGLQRANGAT